MAGLDTGSNNEGLYSPFLYFLEHRILPTALLYIYVWDGWSWQKDNENEQSMK